MPGESTNLPMGGSDNAHPSDALDNPANLNFWEPGDPDNSEVEEDEADPEREPDETAEDGQEADESETADATEAETEGEAAEAEDPEIKDDVVVNVNGEKVALSDLKAGYMRQSDYSRKTQELGNKRRDLEALTTRVTSSVSAIADFLSKQIPDAPDASLAMTDPGRYVREKAMHESAMAQVTAIIEQANAPKEAANKLTAEQRSELLQVENAKLAEAFPQTATPEGRQKFFESAASAARELGYSVDEIGQVADHRMFALAHYARLGMAAEKAKAKATQKVAGVPPVAPAKRQPGPNASKVRANQDAMKRLSRTGSIHDAMKIDFD